MRYQKFREHVNLSKLGLGAMRLPQTEQASQNRSMNPKRRN